LRELIRIDLDLAGESGRTIPVEKYLAELPEHTESIKASYDRHQTRISRQASSSVVELQLSPGQEFGSYSIVDRIGEGGMGQVYHARHKTMDRDVALKVLTPKLMDSPDAVARFHREIKAAAKLQHPHIVSAFDAGEQDGLHFLVMEFVDGRDLSSYVKTKGPLSLKQAIKCIIQAAKGLAYAHEQNIIHRDIKPANLLVDRKGNVKVLDMGLARFEMESENHELTELTGTGVVMETIDYMAPEQSLDTRTADARSDIYSLGCTFWYLLTGKSVYSGDTMMKKLLAHRDEEIPSLRKYSAKIPNSVEQAFRKMVAKQQDDRYQSMQEVIDALQRCLSRKSSSGSSSDLSMAADPKLASFMKDVEAPKPTSGNMEHEDSKSHTNPHEATVIGQPADSVAPTQSRSMKAISTGKLPKWVYGVGAGILALIVAAFLIPRGGEKPSPTISENTELNNENNNVGDLAGEPKIPVQLADVEWLPSEAQESAADLLATGKWEWRIEKNLGPVINSPDQEKSADISADGKLAVVARTSRDWHAQDFWIATRDSVGSDWNAVVRLPESINTQQALEHPVLTVDGSGLLFTNRPGKVPPTVLQWSQRALNTNVWTPPRKFELPGSGPFASINLTADGRTMIVSRLTLRGKNDLLWSQRSSTSEPWPEPVPLGSRINTNGDEYTGTISNDRRMLIFQRGPDRGPDQKIIGPDLWLSLRTSESSEWSTPVPLEALNSPQRDAKPRLLADGKTLVFSSDRPGGEGGLDIWQGRLVPTDRPAKSHPATEIIKSKVLYFDGRDDWVKAPHYVPDTTKPFTMEFWFSMDGGESPRPMHLANGGSIYIRTDEEARVYMKYLTSPDTTHRLESKTPLEPGNNHLAVCFDGKTLSFYLQG
jgi:serine/threonine protein kinase